MVFTFTTKSDIEWDVDRIDVTYVGVYVTLDETRGSSHINTLVRETSFNPETTPLFKYNLPGTGRGDALTEAQARSVFNSFKRKGEYTVLTPGHTWTVTHDGDVYDSTTGRQIESCHVGLC